MELRPTVRSGFLARPVIERLTKAAGWSFIAVSKYNARGALPRASYHGEKLWRGWSRNYGAVGQTRKEPSLRNSRGHRTPNIHLRLRAFEEQTLLRRVASQDAGRGCQRSLRLRRQWPGTRNQAVLAKQYYASPQPRQSRRCRRLCRQQPHPPPGTAGRVDGTACRRRPCPSGSASRA